MASTRQALHWVFKVPSPRAETIRFYRDVLGMQILRHEEFEKGCEAACNGPYDGKYENPLFKLLLTTFKASVLTFFFPSLDGVKLWLGMDLKMITS